ncbi:glycosyltransferase involved in cell wall biosynthesis [Roseiarcus fermentans]|uniref:Glycosyltransferase involved in cell wall biosynthesis n=1 Tax=Roseiarcus fermentans TaxID=1473586 RepID=A0A366F086_9HYPH|nr:glycosyltransferase family 4 protein [Roseiarcus fermentans]RBP07115.1 glycosyltransferase involved in cell wall biosynthesis [Roseiarcus fermentans]
MRILMLTQFYHPAIGGEERHVRDLAGFLVGRGHHVAVATVWRDGLPEREVDQGVRIVRIKGLTQRWRGLFTDPNRTHVPPFPDPGLTAALWRVIASERIEVVHAHNWLLHAFLPLKRANGPRLVVTLHDLSLACVTKSAIHRGETCSGPALRKCAACAADHYGAAKGSITLAANWMSGGLERRLVDRFLPVSAAVAVGNRLVDGPTPWEVVPNFVRDDVASPGGAGDERLAGLPREPFILFVGDLRRFKGVAVLSRAYAGLEGAPPLVLIGRNCPDTPTQWPSNTHVFHDWPHDAVMHAWSRSLAGVLPSIGPEACATVLMEGMASGRPMIATRVGGNPDIVHHDVNGLLVRPGDSDGLAQAIAALAADEGLRSRLAAGARRTVKAFMASSVGPRIEAVYRDVLDHRRPAPATAAGIGFGDLCLPGAGGEDGG